MLLKNRKKENERERERQFNLENQKLLAESLSNFSVFLISFWGEKSLTHCNSGYPTHTYMNKFFQISDLPQSATLVCRSLTQYSYITPAYILMDVIADVDDRRRPVTAHKLVNFTFFHSLFFSCTQLMHPDYSKVSTKQISKLAATKYFRSNEHIQNSSKTFQNWLFSSPLPVTTVKNIPSNS